jgi:hypothetical protein
MAILQQLRHMARKPLYDVGSQSSDVLIFVGKERGKKTSRLSLNPRLQLPQVSRYGFGRRVRASILQHRNRSFGSKHFQSQRGLLNDSTILFGF